MLRGSRAILWSCGSRPFVAYPGLPNYNLSRMGLSMPQPQNARCWWRVMAVDHESSSVTLLLVDEQDLSYTERVRGRATHTRHTRRTSPSTNGFKMRFQKLRDSCYIPFDLAPPDSFWTRIRSDWRYPWFVRCLSILGMWVLAFLFGRGLRSLMEWYYG